LLARLGLRWEEGRRQRQPAMAASARPGERATSFAVACSLLSRFVRQNGAAPAQLGLGIKGEQRNQAAAPARPALLSVEIGILLGARGWGSVQFQFLWGTCSPGARSGRALCYIRFGNDVFGLRIRTPLSVSLPLFFPSQARSSSKGRRRQLTCSPERTARRPRGGRRPWSFSRRAPGSVSRMPLLPLGAYC
jgi:hypothetical protein